MERREIAKLILMASTRAMFPSFPRFLDVVET